MCYILCAVYCARYIIILQSNVSELANFIQFFLALFEFQVSG